MNTHEQQVKELLGAEYFDPEAESNEQKKCHALLIQSEMEQQGVWDASDEGHDALVDNWIYNVEHTKRWTTPDRVEPNSKAKDGLRLGCTAGAKGASTRKMMKLDIVGFSRHVKVTSKFRRYHGIEFVLNKHGDVRTPKRTDVQKVIREVDTAQKLQRVTKGLKQAKGNGNPRLARRIAGKLARG